MNLCRRIGKAFRVARLIAMCLTAGFVPAVVCATLVAAAADAAPINPEGVAVIIGNRNYEHAHEVRFAHRDADAFRRYVTDVLGFGEDRILDYRDANLAELLDLFGAPGHAERTALWSLLDIEGRSDVVVFYSGHGMPGSDGRGYLLPVNGHPARPQLNGYAIETLEENLASLDARSFAVYLDACFSGASHAGSLVANVSGMYREAPLPDPSTDRMVVLTAASATETAFWDEEAGHGMFTNHLLDALYGAADADADARVTAREAHGYVRRKVAGAVRITHRDNQTPGLRGAAGQVLALTGSGVFPQRPEVPGGGLRTWPFTVLTEPVGALVRVVNIEERYRPGMELAAGEYRVEASLEGYETVVEIVHHGSEGATEHRIALRRVAQPFTVLTDPAGARVRFLNIEERYRPGMELAAGEYRVEVSLEGHETAVRTVRHASAPTLHRIALRRAVVRRSAGERFRDCPDCPEMVVIPAGRFEMGCDAEDCDDDEKPVHEVRIRNDFALGRYEVTVGEFRRFAEATGYRTDAEKDAGRGCRTKEIMDRNKWGWTPGRSWRNLEYAVEDRQPVTCVSWNDAKAYMVWLGERTGAKYRLPSEAEWEYAVRVGTRTRYHFGDAPERLCAYGNVADGTKLPNGNVWKNRAECEDGAVYPTAVGSYRPNAFGLYDMHGNVREWVEDCSNGSYAGAPSDGVAWVSGDCAKRVLRGGSWSYVPGSLRAAYRSGDTTGNRNSYDGFRVARTLTP